MHNFRKLEVYQEAMVLTKKVFNLTSTFPESEKYGLTSQLNRAAVSIPSNIAEGSSRSSNKEFARYIEIAIGSLFELETQIIISQEFGLLKEKDKNEVIEEAISLQRRLSMFKQKIKKD